jgi:hypothetical protein
MLPSTISFVLPPSYVSPYSLLRIIHHFHPDLRRHSHILQRHAMPKFPRDNVSWARTSIRVSRSPVSVQHHRQKGVKLTNSSHILEVPTVPSSWSGWKVTRKRECSRSCGPHVICGNPGCNKHFMSRPGECHSFSTGVSVLNGCWQCG